MSYSVRRLLQMLVVMWLVATIVFVLFRIIPGDPATVVVGRDSTQEAREAMRAEMGLDRPVVVQYVTWLGNVLQGDLGTAFTQGGIPAPRRNHPRPTSHPGVGRGINDSGRDAGDTSRNPSCRKGRIVD